MLNKKSIKIKLLTQNHFKIKTAELAFQPFGIEVIPLNINIPEIQADSNIKIARHSAQMAAQQLGEPVVREDHGFYLNAFPGWPGPYMAHTEHIISPECLLKLIGNNDRTGYFEMALAYAKPNKKIIEFSFKIPTKIVKIPRSGKKDFGWDSIISLGENSKTLSEYLQADRYALFTHNFIQLAKML